MKFIKENLGNIILFLGEIVVGIILLIKPFGFTKVIIMGIGLLLSVLGVLNVIRYFQLNAEDAAKGSSLSMGLISLAGGMYCTFNADWFIATFPVLTALYGVVILFTGFKKIQWTVDSIRLKKDKWYIVGVSAIISILFAVIVIYNPFKTMEILWRFIGIVLIIQAVMDVIALVFSIKAEPKNIIEGKLIEQKSE